MKELGVKMTRKMEFVEQFCFEVKQLASGIKISDENGNFIIVSYKLFSETPENVLMFFASEMLDTPIDKQNIF